MSGKRRPRTRWSNTPPPARVRESKEPPAPVQSSQPPRSWEEEQPTRPSFEPSEAPPPVAPRVPDRVAAPPPPPEPEPEQEEEEEEEEERPSEPPPRPAFAREEREHEEEPPPPSERVRHDEPAPAYEPAPKNRFGWLTAAIVAAALVGVFMVVRAKMSRGSAPPATAQTVARPAPPPPPTPAPVNSQAAALLTVIENDLDGGLDLDVDAAVSERREAVRALEKRDVQRALELAEDATAHDPTDADGWLILGAVHLYKGDAKSAQQAFKDCATKAKVGRKDHCLALLGQ